MTLFAFDVLPFGLLSPGGGLADAEVAVGAP